MDWQGHAIWACSRPCQGCVSWGRVPRCDGRDNNSLTETSSFSFMSSPHSRPLLPRATETLTCSWSMPFKNGTMSVAAITVRRSPCSPNLANRRHLYDRCPCRVLVNPVLSPLKSSVCHLFTSLASIPEALAAKLRCLTTEELAEEQKVCERKKQIKGTSDQQKMPETRMSKHEINRGNLRRRGRLLPHPSGRQLLASCVGSGASDKVLTRMKFREQS